MTGAAGRGRALPWAALSFLLTPPVVVWWLTDDHASYDASLDYLVRPPAWNDTLERWAGILAAAIFAVTVVVMVRSTRARRVDPRWWLALLPLVIAGVVVGGGARVVTDGVIGANIGGGLVLVFGTPFVLIMLIAALVTAWWLVVRRRRSMRSGRSN